jgi:hypothetical protein
MGDMLVEWCKKNDLLLLSAITPDQAIKFRMSLPFLTGDSSSLSVHWSVIGGFFNWAVGMGYIEKTPILSGRQNKAIRHSLQEEGSRAAGTRESKDVIPYGIVCYLFRADFLSLSRIESLSLANKRSCSQLISFDDGSETSVALVITRKWY